MLKIQWNHKIKFINSLILKNTEILEEENKETEQIKNSNIIDLTSTLLINTMNILYCPVL